MITNIVILTAYCWCAKCCGESGKPTASGVMPKVGVTIAAPRSIPLGTKVYLGSRTLIVQDRTSRKYNGRWDLFVESHEQAKKFGKKKVEIHYDNRRP